MSRKNPAAVALGRKGGSAGTESQRLARVRAAAAMRGQRWRGRTKEQRAATMATVAKARWAKAKPGAAKI